MAEHDTSYDRERNDSLRGEALRLAISTFSLQAVNGPDAHVTQAILARPDAHVTQAILARAGAFERFLLVDPRLSGLTEESESSSTEPAADE